MIDMADRPAFMEETWQRYFLLFLKQMINRTGNYGIEACTRTMRRTDMNIDYHRKQFVFKLNVCIS